mgnify:CR=1 FL=1
MKIDSVSVGEREQSPSRLQDHTSSTYYCNCHRNGYRTSRRLALVSHSLCLQHQQSHYVLTKSFFYQSLLSPGQGRHRCANYCHCSFLLAPYCHSCLLGPWLLDSCLEYLACYLLLRTCYGTKACWLSSLVRGIPALNCTVVLPCWAATLARPSPVPLLSRSASPSVKHSCT